MFECVCVCVRVVCVCVVCVCVCGVCVWCVCVCVFWCALWEQFSDQQRSFMKTGKNVTSKDAARPLQCHFVTFYYK